MSVRETIMYRNLLKQNALRLFICCAIAVVNALGARVIHFISDALAAPGQRCQPSFPLPPIEPRGASRVGLGLQLRYAGRATGYFCRDASLNGVPDELSNINAGLSKTTCSGLYQRSLFKWSRFGQWTLGHRIAAFVDRGEPTGKELRGIAHPSRRWTSALVSHQHGAYTLQLGHWHGR